MTTETEGAAEAVAEVTTLAPDTEGQEPEAQEASGDDAAASTDEPAERPRPTAKDRINELTRDKHEAKREADAAKAEAEYWRQEALRQQKAEAPKPPPKEDAEPDPANYTYGETDAAFIRDAAKYEARLEVRREMAQERERDQFQSNIRTFEQRVSQQYPDGEPAGISALRRAPNLPQPIAEIILTSEHGPKLADHLGSHPAEFNRLSALAPHTQAYELAKLEMRLTAKPQPKTLTNAPDPTPTVRGAGGQFKAAPDTSDFAAFEKQYG
jgi:hypothetical protein